MGYRKNCDYKKLESRVLELVEQVENDNAINDYIAKMAFKSEQETSWMAVEIKDFRKNICDLYATIRKIKESEKIPERWFAIILILEGVQFISWAILKFM